MIILIGSNGKMGECLKECFNNNGLKFLAIDKHNRNLLKANSGDVVVDFSCSEALESNLEFAKINNLPIVIGTTNHNKDNKKLLQKYKKHIPIFYSANMSIMFNVFSEIISKLKVLKDCDFVIEETHHKHKKDKPSGSAKLLASSLNKVGIIPQIFSVRAGIVCGEHTLKIYGENEVLQIKHSAQNREVFANGTLKAIEFICKQKPGLYSMGDMLKIDSL